MTIALLGLGAITGILWLGALIATLRGVMSVPRMRDVEVSDRDWPRISLVRPACNEGLRLEAATQQALSLDYPDLQVVLINDRSTDETPAIIDQLAGDERVVAVHVSELPDGWLGKLNAMEQGVKHADGEWLLFADADSHFAAGTLQRAVTYADRAEVDFVSVLPGVEHADFLADASFSAANAFLCAGLQPWKIERDDTTIAGTGAFMLVRRTAFERTPGFEWLKLEVSDDFGLCLMIKQHGGRAAFLVAPKSVRLTWYASFGEMVTSMQKNFFAISGRFSGARCLLQAIVLVMLAVGPFAALFADSAWSLPVGLVGIGASVLNGLIVAWWTDRPIVTALLPWLGLLATAFIVIRSAIIGVRNGGIIWRGVLYRTEDLRDVQRVKL